MNSYSNLKLSRSALFWFLNTSSIQRLARLSRRDLKMFTQKTTIKNNIFIQKDFYTTDAQYMNNKNNNILDIEYERAIQALNSLQSNADTLRKCMSNNIKQSPLSDTVKQLERTGFSLDEVEKLSFIHVSGTKGKGSTCALTESILKEYGIKTGYFSSPHLVSVRERIRLNGETISKQKFVDAFWPVFEKLQQTSKHAGDMPAYFRFLFLLSLHVFLAEKVDVVILEVGIGGELDCTNIIRNTGTVGICSLGLEHVNILGNTLPEIAWQKAGIIKEGCHVFTSANQTECLQVIKQRAAEKKALLHIVPSIEDYENNEHLRNFNDMVHLNGSLAIHLAYDWLKQNKNLNIEQNLQINNKIMNAFRKCIWPGRCQKLQLQNFMVHLDGAHTLESMEVCCDWFTKSTQKNNNKKVLVFNSTGERDSRKLLSVLQNRHKFDFACFVPNITSTAGNAKENQTMVDHSEQLKFAHFHANNWISLDIATSECKVFDSILDSFQYLQQHFNDNQPVDVLVTGSLHLIGATLVAFEKFQKLN